MSGGGQSDEPEPDFGRPRFPVAAHLDHRDILAARARQHRHRGLCPQHVPGQRSATHACDWGFRVLIGAMWWEPTLWKLPPSYTDHPEQPFGETDLAYWMS